ncbi:MAG: DUF3108 domain-containing protein [Pseudomonadota bacterium]
MSARQERHSPLAWLTLLLALSASVSASAQTQPRQYEAVYTLRFSVARGEAEVSLRQQEDGTYVYNAVTEPTGLLGVFVRGSIRETSTFTVADGRLVPLRYERVDSISSDERDMEITFDWENGVAVTRFDETTENVSLSPSHIDPGLVPVAVMFDLSQGREPGPYTLIERGRLEPVDVGADGDEKLKTGAGTYPSARFSHGAPELGRITRLWAAPDLGHLMVQMAQYKGDKERAKLTLKSVEFLPMTAP